MYWPDMTFDHRVDSTAEYALLIPKDEIQKVKHIAQNPDLLVKIFQKVFSQYDNSKGKMKIREGREYIKLSDIPA
jgi:RecB family endonuclease NucS